MRGKIRLREQERTSRFPQARQVDKDALALSCSSVVESGSALDRAIALISACSMKVPPPAWCCVVLRGVARGELMGGQAQARMEKDADPASGGKLLARRLGLSRGLAQADVTAPPELRAALLQVSQGVEHLHSLRIVHR